MTQQFDYPPDREADSAAKVRALEALLIEKGVITPTTVDKVLGYFESEMTPLNGKKIVARAWVDPAFAELLANDTPAAIAQCGRAKASGRATDQQEGRSASRCGRSAQPTRTCLTTRRCRPQTPGRTT